ncbi:MAG: response regulator, partial [Caldilineaceae bacterium]|nr:response regulator [Caldilineaceae bacterium]
PPWASRAVKPTNGIPLNIDTVARQGVEAEIPQWTVLIVDDEPEVHQVTILALQRFTYAGRGLRFLSAYSAKEAEALMAVELDIAVVLLDVVMETNQAGLDFVHYLRKELKNTRTRIILRTGQPGEAPEEAIIREYDINDYKTKTELTRQKLCTTILVSLRTYEQLLAFEANQRELEVLYHHLSERNSELQRAKDIAEAASQAKDEFLSLMNHELRTPLNVILMRAEILDNGVHGHLSVKQKNSLELIRNSGHHLLSIIDDILDLAGIETGKLSVSPRPISANDA